MELVDGTLKSKEWAKAEEKLAVLKRKSGRLIAAVGRKVEKGVPLNCCVRIVAFLVYRTLFTQE
ncbi:hypothetical protein M3Y99_01345800 [Aphelenchoides fujianensis]|nr:hypothetical protein M3Y99_01345800 [Aphelenchoides fujianensis]